MTDTWESGEPGDITDRQHLSTVYTTQEEMERIFGVEARAEGSSFLGPVDLRVDDDGNYATAEDDELQALYDVQEEATHEMNFWLLPRYETAALVKNTWVRRACAYLACYFLSQRRGDPTQFAPQVERIRTTLAEIFYGRRDIPSTAQRSDATEPAMSNLVVSDWFSQRKLRVQQSTSEGGTDGSQHPEYINPREY